MRIGIMTLRLHKNYGGILQNYALNRVLREMGHEVETINIVWDLKIYGLKKYYVYLKRLIKNCLKLKWNPLNQEEKIMKEDLVTTKYTSEFKKKNIPLSEKIYYMPYADFSDVNEKYDAVVVGSDQVWRPLYTKVITRYFLDFITNKYIKKIAYAASFGTDRNEFTRREANECRLFLEKFHAVSVREDGGIKLIKDILKWNVDVAKMVDPTLLIDLDEYKKIIGPYKETNKIFVYILDRNPDKDKVVKDIEERLSTTSFTLTPDGMRNDSLTVIPPVEEWLKSIISSQFVVTDSFHGCVFSILFNKPFIVYGNKFRGKSRFDSLLETFGLQDRYIESSSNYDESLIDSSIEWNKINKAIKEKRIIAFEFLNKSLS